MNSPLKKPGDLARLATQLDTRPMDYAAVSRMIDADIDRFDRRQKSFREERRQKTLDEARNYRLGMLKAEQQKGLMIDSNSGYSSIDNYFRQAGRGLADEASNLVSLLSKNEITSDEFANKYSTIAGQVEQLKPFAAGIKTMMTNYRTDLANGTLSAANQGMYENLYEAISQDKGNLFLDDNGVLVYEGQTVEGPDGKSEPFSIPINQLQSVPQPIKKVDPIEALTKPIADILSVPQETTIDDGNGNLRTIKQSTQPNLNNTAFSSGVRGAFDEFLKAQGNNGLKSLAVDHLGMELEEMEAKLDSGPFIPSAEDFTPEEINKYGLDALANERFSSQLEFEMEKEFVKTAAMQTDYKILQSKMQAEIDIKNQQLAIQRQNAARQESKGTAGTLAERQMNSRQNLLKSDLAALGNSPDFSDPSFIANLNQDTSEAVQFEYKDGKLFAVGQTSDGDDREVPINNMYDFLYYYGAGHGVSPAELLSMGFNKAQLRQQAINYPEKQKQQESKGRNFFTGLGFFTRGLGNKNN